MLHILCGDGKGKTTSAVGMAVRAAGRGKRIAFVQLLKGMDTGEINILKTIANIDVIRCDKAVSFDYKNMPDIKEIHNNMLDSVNISDYDMVILDEIAAAYNYDYIDKAAADKFIFGFPKDKELVLTGRDPSKKWTERADYISEIIKIKHPFDKGVKAREGIEL